MNRPASSKYVPGLPADDDIDTPTNENTSSKPDSIKIYDGIAECTMNDADTLKSIKIRAKDLAIQKVQLKIADYVYGFWKDRYLTLPEDEVLSIANEICTITDVKYNVLDSDDNTLIRATVLAQVDDNDVMNYIIQFFKERNELKIQNESLRKENEDLKRQIAKIPNKVILFCKKYDEARELYSKEDYEGAIKLFDEAIELELELKDYRIYEWRGSCYQALKQYEIAIKKFSDAIELFPNVYLLYKGRGICYQALGKYEQAITDYFAALKISLLPDYLYEDIGDCHKALREYKQAITAYSTMIEIHPHVARLYKMRGECYQALGDNAKAQADLAKYEELSKKS